jgi:hypothetical protein
MSGQPDEALEVLREIWSATGQTSAALDAAEGPQRSCRRMADVGFGGPSGDDADLRTAWRDRLRRDGKLDPAGETIADLVLGRPSAR